MYQSNRSFNIPSRAIPRAFEFLENFCSNSNLITGPKSCSNAPPRENYQITVLTFKKLSIMLAAVHVNMVY